MKNFPLRNFLLAALFAVLTAVGAMISIPLPYVPFSMQTFVVLLSGLLLGPKYGPLSQVFYVSLGLIGLPVFAGGTGGLQHVFSPTFGFLIAFVAASWIGGTLAPGTGSSLQYILVCLAATVGLYATALPCFYVLMRFALLREVDAMGVLKLALLPFLVPDLIKAVAAGCLARRVIPLLREAGLLSR
jgi:biotin transport system substrate-specific component